MDHLLSSQAMEASTPERGTRRMPLRRAGRAGIGNTGRGDTTNELAVQTLNALGGAKLIRFAAVQERVSMGRTAVYELIKAGKFPRPVKVGAASAWIDVEITRWIQELAAKRDAPG
jgi:prophage regulatory protein